jgi:hypothetical protein
MCGMRVRVEMSSGRSRRGGGSGGGGGGGRRGSAPSRYSRYDVYIVYHKQDFKVSCFGTCFVHQFDILKSVYKSFITRVI